MTGILAVWNDCAPGVEADYERWYTQQHLIERLSVPGFIVGRRYEARSGDRRFFSYYETVDDEVLRSDAYLARLQNPTEWTQRIMPSFTNAIRTVCTVAHRSGRMDGGHVLTVRDQGGQGGDEFARLAENLGTRFGVTKVQLWQAASSQTPQTAEARNRPTPDGHIHGALVIDCLRLSDAEDVAAEILKTVGTTHHFAVGVFTLLCTLFAEAPAR
jgi:hypothetical protein